MLSARSYRVQDTYKLLVAAFEEDVASKEPSIATGQAFVLRGAVSPEARPFDPAPFCASPRASGPQELEEGLISPQGLDRVVSRAARFFASVPLLPMLWNILYETE
ncbi:hypothetical protein MRX96_035465 [Rhipicephalus microplus]